VHGLPKKEKVLKAGDVVGLDVGMQWPTAKTQNRKTIKTQSGLYTDMAVTIGIGKVSEEAERLMRITKESLVIGIKAIKPGVKLGDIGFVIQEYLEKNKLGVIRSLAGHGVGYAVHEEPLVPNFGKRGTGLELKKGMVLAIEPMASLGDWELEVAKDGWTFKTKDGSLGAHFEHTISVTADGAEILTIV
jgi:methionyl aminopeptidase